tara:strand:- start:4495 stop:6468 length:1974 start_codon:yes stop_codon:yes gene_type:complete
MLSTSNPLQNKTRIITRRMFILGAVKITIFFAIVARLFYLQISENIKYRTLSDKNRLREWKVPPQRGVIEDFFGEKIAHNTQLFQLHMIPEDVPNLGELLFRISKLINFDQQQRKNLLKRIKRRKPWEPVIVSSNLTWAEFSKLNLFLHEIQGIKPVVAVTRKYSQDGSTSHLIGYVSDVSELDLENSKFLRDNHVPGLKTGKTGLEKSFNNTIIGKAGFQRYEVNAYGKRVKEVKSIEGTEGKNFKTTLDADVQRFANELIKDKSGAVCIMDIYRGDIIAMTSSPTFDANKFVRGITNSDWQELIKDENKPLINKPIAGLYPPGSTIKPIVALSALEHDVISPKLVVECKGEIELYGHKYHCWKEKGHGYMSLREGLKQSCDIYFYEVARRLGVDRLAITAKKFGLGDKVFNIFDEERSGVVPTTKWKLKNIGKGWVLGETLITGIGQGYFQTTPMQLCLMTAQLANGGYKITSRIIKDDDSIEPIIRAWKKELAARNNEKLKLEVSQDSKVVIPKVDHSLYSLEKLYRNPENVKLVLEALYAATNEPMGTSYRSRHTKSEYIYAGKTGTSQIRAITAEEREAKIKNEDRPYKQRDHALFTAYAPYKNPRYAFSIIIEHGGSGSSGAAPIAKKLIKKVLDRDQMRKKQQQDLFQYV